MNTPVCAITSWVLVAMSHIFMASSYSLARAGNVNGLSPILIRSPISFTTAASSLTIHCTSAMKMSQASSIGLSLLTPEKSGGWNRLVKSDWGGTITKSGRRGLGSSHPPLKFSLYSVIITRYAVATSQGSGKPRGTGNGGGGAMSSSSSVNGRSSPCPVTDSTTDVSLP